MASHQPPLNARLIKLSVIFKSYKVYKIYEKIKNMSSTSMYRKLNDRCKHKSICPERAQYLDKSNRLSIFFKLITLTWSPFQIIPNRHWTITKDYIHAKFSKYSILLSLTGNYQLTSYNSIDQLLLRHGDLTSSMSFIYYF